MTTRVALAGATGNLGPAILNALLEANFSVTVLTRHNSKSASSLPKHSNLTIAEVDYTSTDSLTTALTSNQIQVVISNFPTHSVSSQKPLIDASIVSGVTRFIPSDFGSNINNPRTSTLPMFAGKLEIQAYIKSLATTNPSWSYTFVENNAFFDYCLKVPVIVNLKEHKATLIDGGDHRFSTTTLPTVGKAVVGVINNLSATANRTVRIQSTQISQNDIIGIAKAIDGKEWETNVVTSDECERAYKEEMAQSQPNMTKVIFNQLYCAVLGDGWENTFTKNDNGVLGIKEMTDGEVRELIKGYLLG